MIIFVTGATSGFGEAIARRFIREGHQVIDAGRRLERLEELQDELGQALHIVRLDVRNRAAIQQAIEALPAELRQIDVLVNNAGVFAVKPFVDFTPQEIEEQISTNLKGVLYMSQEAARHMGERGRGRIVNITAALALQPHASVPALLAVALKGGVNQATRALALELAPRGVTVNAVAPGVVDTPMHPAESHAALGDLHPLGRIARADEIAAAVRYLVGAEFVTGAVVPVDGGFSAGR